jgi:hypothetical protein
MPAAAVTDDLQEGQHHPSKKKVKGKGKGKGRSSKVETITSHDPQTDPIDAPDPSEMEEKVENEKVSSSVTPNLLKTATAYWPRQPKATAGKNGTSSTRPILHIRQAVFGTICK